MRILHVSERFHPEGGGGEIASWELCQALASRGHEVTALTTGSVREERLEGVRIIRPVRGGQSRPGRQLAAWRLAARVRQHLRQQRPDLVHVMAYTMSVPVSRAAARADVPCVTSVHSFLGDDWTGAVWYGRAIGWLERRAIRKDRSAVIHVPSSYMREKLARAVSRIEVIPNWCPEGFPSAKRLPPDTMVFVGDLEWVKDPLACLDVAGEGPLVMIGSGRLEERLRRRAAAMAVDITLISRLERREVLAYLGGASLVLVPSVSEAFSVVALEAVAQGTPVSGRAVGILPELPGVVAWPPTEIPNRLPDKEVARIRQRFSRDRVVREFERLYAAIAG